MHPPLAVFEVLSPEDRLSRFLRKLNDYADMGVSQIWVVDPAGPGYYRFAAGALRSEAEFGAPGQAMSCPLAAVRELLD